MEGVNLKSERARQQESHQAEYECKMTNEFHVQINFFIYV